MPPPFVGWIETMAGMLARARQAGEIGAGVEPEPAASVLVCAFFGTHIVSDALDARELIEDRVTQLWLHFLPALRPPRDPAEILERAHGLTRYRIPAREADQSGMPPRVFTSAS
jgi:hypothetical protein